MASSPPAEGDGGSTLGGAAPPDGRDTTESPPPPSTKWPKWRVLMLIGAFVLLGASILGTVDDLPQWPAFGLYVVGYVFLSYGFFTAMSARRGGSTPRDRG